MRNRKWMPRCALLLFATMAASAQTYDFTELDRFLEQAVQTIPTGFEVAIVQNGQPLYSKAYGPWTKDRQVSIASATKWLSGALIMSLVDDGLLSLDDRASKYLPYLTNDKASITIRQLMSHTAGFPGEFPLADPCLGDSSGTLAQCAEALARVPLQAAPGTAFIYSGADMQIAGRVAEVVSGKDWQTLFRERIAGPLGMTATDYEYQGPTQNPRISGGGRSSASDYLKFLTMIYQRGMYNGRRVLSTRAIDAMLVDQTNGAPIVESPFARTDGDFRYGIGNWVENPDSSGRASDNSSIGVAGWTPLIDSSRNLLVMVGMQNVLKPFQPYYLPMKAILHRIIPPAALTPRSIVSAATYEAGPVATREALSIFFANPGPARRVLFDDVPALLLYASPGQAIAVPPADVAGRSSVMVKLEFDGAASPAVPVPVAAAWPGLFTADASGRGQVAAFNQDGSLNAPANAAPRGTMVRLFGTATCSGAPLSVSIGGQPAPVASCAPADGSAPGVFQLTVTVPAAAAPGAAVVVIRDGEQSSLPIATISVR